MRQKPSVLVIGGINGAGKTTCAKTLLPNFKRIDQFVNADEIARGISPFAPESVAMQAGKVALDRIRQLRETRESFAFESTLAGRSYSTLLRQMKLDGYEVELFYVWLPDAETAIRRVANRVALGGHHIPDETIRKRYGLSIHNAVNLYIPLADEWTLCDNSMEEPRLIASGGVGIKPTIVLTEIYDEINKQKTT